jgi:hypothetical protein
VTLHQRDRDSRDLRVQQLKRTVELLNREVQLRAALSDSALSERGFPAAIDPEWFQETLPRNPLLGDGRPWVEVAPIEQHHSEHPPDIAPDHRLAADFWYNPGRGSVRARVPAGLSDRETLELYNMVNGCTLRSRFPVAGPTTP